MPLSLMASPTNHHLPAGLHVFAANARKFQTARGTSLIAGALPDHVLDQVTKSIALLGEWCIQNGTTHHEVG